MKIVSVEPIGMDKATIAHYEDVFSGSGHQFTCFPDRKEDAETLKLRMHDADIVIVSNIQLTREILMACPGLKMLSVAFTGLDHIDLEYCRSQGIAVYNASGYATVAVAELVVGLIINLYRHISSLETITRQGGSRGNILGRQIKGKTAGIIGTGQIGKATALYLKALGCDIIAWSRRQDDELLRAGIRYLSLEKLMSESDIISLHLPLTSETDQLISAQMLSLCKPDAILINTARGNIVDIHALARTLHDHKIAGAAIDVFEKEPPLPPDHPLLHAPNCIVVPHIGFATSEAFKLRIEIVMNNIIKWMDSNF